MNLRYLGDALDHWKGSLFEYLANVGVLREFAVDPMASDLLEWAEADYALFARLLRVNKSQIIRHKVRLSDRPRYFAEIIHQGDLFLDPDTGIATSGGGKAGQYIRPREVVSLLMDVPGRLLAVYQHVRAQKVMARVDTCIATVAKDIENFGWCSYESGTVAMLFLSHQPDRTKDVGKALEGLLGRHAVQRVRVGVNRSSRG